MPCTPAAKAIVLFFKLPLVYLLDTKYCNVIKRMCSWQDSMAWYCEVPMLVFFRLISLYLIYSEYKNEIFVIFVSISFTRRKFKEIIPVTQQFLLLVNQSKMLVESFGKFTCPGLESVPFKYDTTQRSCCW